MGAVGPVTPWCTNDDLLLKKALEDGASLESLAKGAVQFSRRFTITELQERWNSLLYDLNTSIEASGRMIEFERSAFKRTSKLKRPDHSKSKEDHCGTGKRKADSVRKCYYAMRKRMRSEPLNLGNISFPGDSYNLSGSEAPSVNNMLLDQIANHFGLEDTSFDHLNVFPQVLRNKTPLCRVDEFASGQPNRLEDSIEQNSVQNEIPPGHSVVVAGNCTGLGQMDPSKKQGDGRHIFQAVEANLVSNSEGIMSPDFGGNTILNSPGPYRETSFSPMHYTSTPPAMPDWKEIEGVSAQGLPDNTNIKGNNVLTGEPFSITDGVGAGEGTSECNVISLEHNRMSFDEMKISTDCSEGYFGELADTLFDFTSEEILVDAIDKSFLDGLSSLLLNSPYDANEEMPIIPETKEPVVPVAYPDIVSTDLEEKIGVGDSHLGIHQCTTENQFPMSASILSPQSPEYCNGVICCTLNTEDPEIPCNDHIVFPSRPRPASGHRRIRNGANTPVRSSKDDNVNQASEKGTVRREPKQFRGSKPTSQMQGPEIQLNHKVDEFGVKFETSGVELLNRAKSPRTNSERPCHSSLAIKKESSELLLVGESGNCVDKSCHVSDSGHLQSVAGGINQESQELPAFRDQGCSGAGLMAKELGGEPLLSDGSEEQYSESDTDIPSFSDVEAMILDMDLEPDDGDSLCNGEVSKYQNKDARAIIRLEQHADSCMQRHIARRGALAMLSRGHSKYYIKKPEVLLGRGTDGVAVDIDLGREGCANLISRCQAVIKMDKDGTFYMKNLGRRSIYVNGQKVEREACVILPSLCSIKITGMWFNFYSLRQSRHVKQRHVKQQHVSNGA